MTKYTVASQRRVKREEQQLSPLWRGVGCLMMVVVPLVSYLLAVLVMQIAVAQEWPLPYQLLGYPVVSPTLWKVGSLAPLWGFIQSQSNLYGILLFTILFIVVLGAVVSFGYAAVYRYVGPPRFGPLDEPPLNLRVKRYKR